MNKLISMLIISCGIFFLNSAYSVEAVCETGPFQNMQNTAYVTVSTDLLDYPVSGYFYIMMISIDQQSRIRGERAASGNKPENVNTSHTLYISGVAIPGDMRRINGTGGLSPYSEDFCSTGFTSILQ